MVILRYVFWRLSVLKLRSAVAVETGGVTTSTVFEGDFWVGLLF